MTAEIFLSLICFFWGLAWQFLSCLVYYFLVKRSPSLSPRLILKKHILAYLVKLLLNLGGMVLLVQLVSWQNFLVALVGWFVGYVLFSRFWVKKLS